MTTADLDQMLLAVRREVERAEAKHKPINSAHEAYAVIAEELDEFWGCVRDRKHDHFAMTTELIQPLLGPVALTPWLWVSGCQPHCGDQCSRDIDCPCEPTTDLHWVICGGESGPGARAMHPDWACSLRDQCAAAGVAFFFKQWGEWKAAETPLDALALAKLAMKRNPPMCQTAGSPLVFNNVGKKAAGRLLDGREHNELPCPH